MSFSNQIIPKLLLIFICLIFLITRLYKINDIPPSVYWDEASISYNAYSVVETGKDEWGENFPIHFRAFGEFKLPIFVYTVALFTKIFGLSIFSVRISAILFSLGVVILTFFLTKELTKNTSSGLLSSLFLTISPWFFIFSRTGYEATAGLMFYLLAIYSFLLVKKNALFLILSVVSFILSAYSYNSFRIITPLTILILFSLNVSEIVSVIKRSKITLGISIIFLALSIIPIYRLYVYDTGISRFQSVSISNPNSLIRNYLSHFSLNFLLLGDKNLRSQQGSFGQLYLPEIVLLSLAILYTLNRRSKNTLLILALILIGPIPAAITRESPHALRSISLVPILSILSALGTFHLKEILKIKFVEVGTAVIMGVFFINYFANFINVYPNLSSQDWQYGYQKIYLDYKEQFKKYDEIIISDEYGQPYIFALFYLKFDPEKFRLSVIRNDVSDWGFSTVKSFDKFRFGKVNELLKRGKISNSLVFATSKDRPVGISPLSTINFLDGTLAFWVYEL